jgi:hypothetical protein
MGRKRVHAESLSERELQISIQILKQILKPQGWRKRVSTSAGHEFRRSQIIEINRRVGGHGRDGRDGRGQHRR